MKQLFVKAEKKYHSRLKYILNFCTADVAEIDWVISESSDNDLQSILIHEEHQGEATGLKSSPSYFLQKGFIRSDLDEKFIFNDQSVWKKSGGYYYSSFDVFGYIFFFLSRMEEYKKDAVCGLDSRFSAKESVLFRLGLIDYPIVDFWRNDFLEVLKKVVPSIEIKHKKFQWELTCDIDVLYAFYGKGMLKNILGLFRDLLLYRKDVFKLRWNWIFSGKNDPFDKLDELIKLTDGENGKLKTFILCPSSGEKLEDISGFQFLAKHEEFLERYNDKIDIGLHPSISCNFDVDRLNLEKEKLEELSQQIIVRSRQHYLLLDIPISYRNLISVGIFNDYSMAFHDHIGFRAGTSLPYYWYDIQDENPTPLKVYPFCLMDINLKKYMRLNPENSLKVVKKMMDKIKAVNGNFYYLWHNSSLSPLDGWSGWENFPSNVKQIAKNSKS